LVSALKDLVLHPSLLLFQRIVAHAGPAGTTGVAAEQLRRNKDFLQLDDWAISNFDDPPPDAAITVADLLPSADQLIGLSKASMFVAYLSILLMLKLYK